MASAQKFFIPLTYLDELQALRVQMLTRASFSLARHVQPVTHYTHCSLSWLCGSRPSYCDRVWAGV